MTVQAPAHSRKLVNLCRQLSSMRILILLALLLCSGLPGFAQHSRLKPKQQSSAEILESIRKLQVLGSALYVAAHPDDENTRLISWLANERQVNTTYLSLTRGDGGQNLIGSEIRELLGVLRSEELLMARHVDGGRQRFSRANDFGYSKHPDETMAIWDRDAVMADMVWTIRQLRPDVIINRFDHASAGRTHGHHTASAMMAMEAFDLAGDADAFPEQLEHVPIWQPSRLFFNTSWWFYGSREAFAEADKSDMIEIDAGVYYPHLGKSNSEIAAESRSMHRCQGFGSTGTRGTLNEYLQLLKGDMPPNDDPFGGLDVSWDRVIGGEGVAEILAEVEAEFDEDYPQAIVPGLVQALSMMRDIPEDPWISIKEQETIDVILQCLGFYAEAVADSPYGIPGDSVSLEVEVIMRNAGKAPLSKVSLLGIEHDLSWRLGALESNDARSVEGRFLIAFSSEFSGPYWLTKEGTEGLYNVEDQLLRGLPYTPRPFAVEFELDLYGETISWTRPLIYKRNDPVLGEIYRPFEVLPPATVSFARPVFLFSSSQQEIVTVKVRTQSDGVSGTVRLILPEGFQGEREKRFVSSNRDEERILEFSVSPPSGSAVGQVRAEVIVNGKVYPFDYNLVEYDHIPAQTVLQPAAAKLARLDLVNKAGQVGYIMGAGDDIPAALEQIGSSVTMLEEADMKADNLSQYDVVIAGIRALNTNERIDFMQPEIFEYVKAGGTYVIQYNTSHRMKTQSPGPYPLKLSRDRVTVEQAKIRILAPDHPVLNAPNKISQSDFDGWVQERGLYFPNEWDEAYTPILSANDPGEPARDGGMLVAQYGDGWFVYTGYSFFRQLPAGVPGAFRLFANIVSLGAE